MGEKLVKYYDYAKKKGGLVARMRLAMKSGLSPKEAAKIEDTPERMARFKEMLAEILKARWASLNLKNLDSVTAFIKAAQALRDQMAAFGQVFE